jgi:hypothetical protein
MIHTLGDLDALHRLVVHAGSAGFDELVALNAEIDHFSALDGELNELLGDIADDLSSSLEDETNVRLFVSDKAFTQLFDLARR